MKKLAAIFISLVAMLSTLGGCSNNIDVVLLVPDGGTLLPLAQLMTSNEKIDEKYTLKGDRVSGTEIDGKLSAQTPDLAIAPLNVASRAFNETKGYAVAAVVVWGNSYIVANSPSSEVELTLENLKDEIVYAFMESAVPGITLKAVLNKNSAPFEVITSPENKVEGKINLLFLASAAAVQTELNKENSEVRYAYLPEPNATAQTLSGAKHIAFDIQEMWGEGSYPQAVLVVKKSFYSAHKAYADKLIKAIEESAEFCLSNAQQAAALAKEDLQSAALPSIAALVSYINGNGQSVMRYSPVSESKNAIKDYLTVLYSANSASVGGSVPSDDFFLA